MAEGWSSDICIEVGSSPLKAQAILEQVDTVLVVDAIEAHAVPGTLHCLDLNEVSLNRREGLHELSLAGVLTLLPAEQRPRGWVLGLQPQALDYGMDLSEPVAQAMPLLLLKIKELWNQECHEAATNSSRV